MHSKFPGEETPNHLYDYISAIMLKPTCYTCHKTLHGDVMLLKNIFTI
jgi:hypothetical protein